MSDGVLWLVEGIGLILLCSLAAAVIMWVVESFDR
jgi:hypothetical protein